MSTAYISGIEARVGGAWYWAGEGLLVFTAVAQTWSMFIFYETQENQGVLGC